MRLLEMDKNSLQHKTKTQLIAEIEELSRHLSALEAAEAERQQAVKALRESEEKYRILLDESSDPIFMFGPDGTYRYVNKAFADGVGRKLEEIIGKKIWDVFPQDEADKSYAAVKWVFENGMMKVIEVRVPRPDGDRYYITTAKPIMTKQYEVISVICISKDITERKQMEEELRYLSTHDTLTNLFNRNFFEVELVRFQDSRLFPVSIVMVDLDNLKLVNDHYGHATGDDLIRKTAQLLKEIFRTEDIIARYGGDEFIVLLPETDEAAVQVVLVRLRAKVNEQQDPLFSLSIGASTGEKGCSLPELISLADDQMYQEKISHKKWGNHFSWP
jgi:diguanylate cyclase (GGDEF)-like protein/PAS domain S-box-containing protein